jgi:hypothetical protein
MCRRSLWKLGTHGRVASPALALFLLLLSGWVNRQQQAVIDYLLEENRVLRAERGSRRVSVGDIRATPAWSPGAGAPVG